VVPVTVSQSLFDSVPGIWSNAFGLPILAYGDKRNIGCVSLVAMEGNKIQAHRKTHCAEPVDPPWSLSIYQSLVDNSRFLLNEVTKPGQIAALSADIGKHFAVACTAGALIGPRSRKTQAVL
jgi:hypothetical protein